MNWFLMVLKKYAVFTGRAQRAEYWHFVLFYILIFVALAAIDGLTDSFNYAMGVGLSMRRLHETSTPGPNAYGPNPKAVAV